MGDHNGGGAKVLATLADQKHTVREVQSSDPHYTVFIRLPFPRGDFVDPPPVYQPKSTIWTSANNHTGEMGLKKGPYPLGCHLRGFEWQCD